MRAGLVSFRLGSADGVSVAAASLRCSLDLLGFDTVTIAGEGTADRIVRGLSRSAGVGPDPGELAAALDDLDLVVVENLLTIPLHPPASRALARLLEGRNVVLRHHDPPWQRARFAQATELPVRDPSWLHTAVCEHTRAELAERGVPAQTLYVGLTPPVRRVARRATRERLGIAQDEVLCIHPVRAIARKDIPAALDLTRQVGGVYWLTGPAEEGYEDETRRLLRSAPVRTIWRSYDGFGSDGIDNAYAASDLVLFPSSWEGFGIPPLEAALRRKPVIVGDYPVAAELRGAGFDWPRVDETERVAELMRDDVARKRMLDRNRAVADRLFTYQAVAGRLEGLLGARGWLPNLLREHPAWSGSAIC